MSGEPPERLSLHGNRVCSNAEADMLLAAGADVVGFQANDMALFELEADPLWSDERYVYAADIAGYMDNLPVGRCLIDLPVDQIERDVLQLIAQKGGHRVQISSLLSPKPETVALLEEANLTVIYGGRYLSPGDGPTLASIAQRSGDAAAAERASARAEALARSAPRGFPHGIGDGELRAAIQGQRWLIELVPAADGSWELELYRPLRSRTHAGAQ